MERGGRKITSEVRSDPLGEKSCKRAKCTICKGEKPGRCDTASAGYRQTCKECKQIGIKAEYEGESSKTAFERNLDHEDDMRKEDLESPLWKHSTIAHESRHIEWEVEVTGIHKTVIERMTDEIVRIKHSKADIVLNSKNDWTQPALIRIVPVTGNRLETQVGDDQPSRNERMTRLTQHSQNIQNVSDNTPPIGPGSNLETVEMTVVQVRNNPRPRRAQRIDENGVTDASRVTAEHERTAQEQRTQRTQSRTQNSHSQPRTQTQSGARGSTDRESTSNVNILLPGLSQRMRRTQRTGEPTATAPSAPSPQAAPRTQRRRRTEMIEEEEEVTEPRSENRGMRRMRRDVRR
jgi:hypothetical protein